MNRASAALGVLRAQRRVCNKIESREVGMSNGFVYDKMAPASEQFQFDDDMDEIFASIPSEQLEFTPASSVASSSKALGNQEHAFYGQWTGSAIRFDDDRPTRRLALQQIRTNNLISSSHDITTHTRQYTSSASNPATDTRRAHYIYNRKLDNVNTRESFPRFPPSELPRRSRPPRSRPPAASRVYEKSLDADLESRRDRRSSSGYNQVKQPIPWYRDDSTYNIRRQREANLQPYSFLRPTGAIGSMRKTTEEITAELSRMNSGPASSSSLPDSEIRLSTHHAAQCHVLSDATEMNSHLKKIGKNETLSFDMEWPYSQSGSGKTSVIQIASAAEVFVLQVGAMDKLPEELIRIIRDPTTIKCGVAIQADATKLEKDFGEEARLKNKVELSNVAKLVDVKRWEGRKFLIALRDLCSIYLGRKLNKDPTIRQGPWAVSNLNARQEEYAASDAYVGLEIIHTLAKMAAVKDGPDPFQEKEVRKLMVKAQVGDFIKGKGELSSPQIFTEERSVTVQVPSKPASLLVTVQNMLSNSTIFGQLFVKEAVKETKEQEEQNLAKAAKEGGKEARSSSISMLRTKSFESPSRVVMPKISGRGIQIEQATMHRIRRLWISGIPAFKIRKEIGLSGPDTCHSLLWSLSDSNSQLKDSDRVRLMEEVRGVGLDLYAYEKDYLFSQRIYKTKIINWSVEKEMSDSYQPVDKS